MAIPSHEVLQFLAVAKVPVLPCHRHQHHLQLNYQRWAGHAIEAEGSRLQLGPGTLRPPGWMAKPGGAAKRYFITRLSATVQNRLGRALRGLAIEFVIPVISRAG